MNDDPKLDGLEGCRVLIVDDTPANVQVLGRVLHRAGSLVNVAQNGRQALESVHRVRPDLILLDWMMPEMDGPETCRRLKADPETQDIPVIFLTSRTESTDVIEGFGLGAVDYVTKPFRSLELLARVRTHLTIAVLRRNLERRVADLNDALGTIDRMYREHSAFMRHELNNSIAPILVFAELLRDQPGASPDRRSTWIEHIITASTSTRDLLASVQRLQAFERGDFHLSRSPIDLPAFVRAEVDRQRKSVEPPVPIDFENECRDGMTSGDKSLLTGVFRNLLKNAAEHVADPGAEMRRVAVRVFETDRFVVTEIRNGGEPIPPDRLSGFFEKFNSTKIERGGTGLGTSFAHLVTVAHEGEVAVRSSAETGTVVTVSLPRQT